MTFLEFLGFLLFMANMGTGLAIMIPDRQITIAVVSFWAVEVATLVII